MATIMRAVQDLSVVDILMLIETQFQEHDTEVKTKCKNATKKNYLIMYICCLENKVNLSQ